MDPICIKYFSLVSQLFSFGLVSPLPFIQFFSPLLGEGLELDFTKWKAGEPTWGCHLGLWFHALGLWVNSFQCEFSCLLYPPYLCGLLIEGNYYQTCFSCSPWISLSLWEFWNSQMSTETDNISLQTAIETKRCTSIVRVFMGFRLCVIKSI